MKIHRKFTTSIKNTFIESEHALNSALTTFMLISILAPPPRNQPNFGKNTVYVI